MCGEQSPFVRSYVLRKGSPPRVRGTVFFKRILHGNRRITPACAGNRGGFMSENVAVKDHPRVCGEQPSRESVFFIIAGSPPRVRGTEFAWELTFDEEGSPPRVRGTGECTCHRPGRGRITPACAGNRLPAGADEPTPLDHPRVCGEQAPAEGSGNPEGGSPPRVRGTDGDTGENNQLFRITPACAGNRRPIPWLQKTIQDHPRVCGEQCRRKN